MRRAAELVLERTSAWFRERSNLDFVLNLHLQVSVSSPQPPCPKDALGERRWLRLPALVEEPR